MGFKQNARRQRGTPVRTRNDQLDRCDESGHCGPTAGDCRRVQTRRRVRLKRNHPSPRAGSAISRKGSLPSVADLAPATLTRCRMRRTLRPPGLSCSTARRKPPWRAGARRPQPARASSPCNRAKSSTASTSRSRPMAIRASTTGTSRCASERRTASGGSRAAPAHAAGVPVGDSLAGPKTASPPSSGQCRPSAEASRPAQEVRHSHSPFGRM